MRWHNEVPDQGDGTEGGEGGEGGEGSGSDE